jgi:hypothetical protein
MQFTCDSSAGIGETLEKLAKTGHENWMEDSRVDGERRLTRSDDDGERVDGVEELEHVIWSRKICTYQISTFHSQASH